ncbi:antibiotic biosynthesis monooxygenase family protein [Pseudomonas sp. YJ42]|uniref:antibiotic biosynthesis monooxygenase family protein n=1 Tax=Pseudomonas sp. YJ42 TaxID=3392115 RepID=UPI0039A06783
MIYEIAMLPVHQERVERFKCAFAEVEPLLKRATGYGGHLLAQGIETPQVLNLIVRWRSFTDHKDFEAGEDHQVFMDALEDYFSEEPTVWHIEGAPFTSAEHNVQDSFFDQA